MALDQQFIDQINQLVAADATRSLKRESPSFADSVAKGVQSTNAGVRRVQLGNALAHFCTHVMRSTLPSINSQIPTNDFSIRFVTFNPASITPVAVDGFEKVAAEIVVKACELISNLQQSPGAIVPLSPTVPPPHAIALLNFVQRGPRQRAKVSVEHIFTPLPQPQSAAP